MSCINDSIKFSVIGAGNGGQAIAGYLGSRGFGVSLYDRNLEKVFALKRQGGIILEGRIQGFGRLDRVTSDLREAVVGTDVIMVATVANAHKELAVRLTPFLEDGQIVVLNPGRTCGAIDFLNGLREAGCVKRVYVAEAQTLVYACRQVEVGRINVIGVKDEVLLSALPSTDTPHVLDVVGKAYECFVPASNVLRTGLENIGAIFHPCVVLFNAATIERGDEFYFYRDMTPQVAEFIESFDAERLEVGKAYGLELMDVRDWISYAYKGTGGNTLCERMRNNPAYYDILAPTSIYSRQLMEDIPTGVLPILELGRAAGLEMRLFKSMVDVCSCLLKVDFVETGRTLKNLGLTRARKEEILNMVR